MIKIFDIIEELEKVAPHELQEDYDNSGLITGNPSDSVVNALVCLDCTEKIIDEAIDNNCNLIIAHHPIIFKGLKKLTGNNYVERTIIKAIQNNIAIYALHTNLDNVLENGVNSKIAQKLGLNNTTILNAKHGLLSKLITYVPTDKASEVREAIFEAGAGHIGQYDECSFNGEGIGTFRGNSKSNPYVGLPGESHHENEIKIETIFPNQIQELLIKALRKSHPYEEVAFDIIPLKNKWPEIGSGLLGELDTEMKLTAFLPFLKEKMNINVIKHTEFNGTIKKIALCGGSGSFLLKSAMLAKADVFITSDFKYHEYFDAEGKILICDIGHFESEQFTPELIIEIIRNKFPNFAPVLAKTNTNPINYYY